MLLLLFSCKSDQPDLGANGVEPDADLVSFFESDSAWRVESQLACTELDLSLRMRLDDDGVDAGSLLSRGVLLAAAEPTGEMGEAAQRWIATVVDATWRARIDTAMALHVEGMTADEYRDVIESVVTGTTYVPLKDVRGEFDTLCGVAKRRAALGPTPQGYACPTSPRPDCAEDPPTEPWGCPPPAQGDCPDCPGLEDAEADLDKLEELFDRARAEGVLDNLLDTLLDTLLDAIESGDPPTPGDLALGVATAVLGPDYPGLTFYVDVLSSTVAGATAGGPLGGLAAMAWAVLTGWGDFVEGSEALGDLNDARSRLANLRRWCEEIDWDAKQEACQEFEAWLFEKRTAECAEAQASYDLAYATWETDQEACDDERAAVDAANSNASAWTSRLRGSDWAFTAAAFEECCDEPPWGPPCPADDSPLDPAPIPPWADPFRFGPLAVVNGRVVRLEPGAGGQLAPFAEGLTAGSAIGAAPGRDEILVSDGNVLYDIALGGDVTKMSAWATLPKNAFVTDIAWAPLAGAWLVTDLGGGRVYLLDGGGSHKKTAPLEDGLSFPVSAFELSDGTVIVAENGAQRVIGLHTSPVHLDTAPYAPQHIARTWTGKGKERILITTADSHGDGAILDLDGAVYATGIFNPSGIAVDPATGQVLVNSFDPAGGATYDITDLGKNTDLSAASPYTSGLDHPDGITFALLPQ